MIDFMWSCRGLRNNFCNARRGIATTLFEHKKHFFRCSSSPSHPDGARNKMPKHVNHETATLKSHNKAILKFDAQVLLPG
jgi:hypothetical protein